MRITVQPKETLLDALLRDGRLTLNPSCGGHGSCARCIVCCKDTRLSGVSARERQRLGDDIEAGYRISCLAFNDAEKPIEVEASPVTV